MFYPETIQAIFNRVESCIPYGTEHLLVMQPVPMIFGDIGALERPLERISKLFRRSKFWTEVIAKCGWWKNDQLKFGEPQLLDDCVDHWSSLHHQMERQMLFAKFGELATARSMRVSWLTGDVHCAGFGRLRTQGTTAETELYDPMTMYQVISSAIGNAPPPVLVRWLFEITDGPPWGVYRLTKRPAKPIKPSHVERTAAAEAASKHLRRADTFYDRIRAEYASRFVGRPIKQDPGDGQAVLGKVEEGLVRIGGGLKEDRTLISLAQLSCCDRVQSSSWWQVREVGI